MLRLRETDSIAVFTSWLNFEGHLFQEAFHECII